MECFTYLRNVQDLLSDGKTPYERRFGKPFEGPIIPFGSLVEYLPYNCEGSVPNPSIWKESLTWIVPRIRIVGGYLEGWRTDRRPWGVGDDGRIGNLLEKTQCERGDISHGKKENLFFQSQMDELNPLEEIKTWEHPPWYGIDQIEERVTLTFLENQKDLFHNLTTHFPDAVEAINDSWSMSGNFMYCHHVEPRVKLYSPRNESFPTPLKYIDESRTTCTILDVKQEKRIDDNWNIDGSRDLFGSLDRFHSVYFL